MIGWEVRILADNEQQDDYLSNMLNALNEKEQESQSYNDPETIARQAKEKLEAENAVKEANEPEREADADAKLEALLDNTPLEEAAEAKLTSDDNSELSDDDMKRLMNMNLDDIIDDVKSDSASIDDLFGSSPDKETEHNEKSADTQAQTISADDKKKLKPQKEGFFKKIKKVFFDSLEDDTETAESASEAAESTSEAVGEKERIEENVVKDSSDKGNSSSGNEPKDENEQIIEDVFGNKSTLDESQVPKKGFFARIKYRLEQMKAKKAAAAEKKEQKKQAGEAKKAQKANKPKNAIELENKGNELLAEGKYENAITFYQTAQAIYVRLELPDLADGINGKIAAARAGIEAAQQAEEEAQRLAREQENTETETKEYGPGAGVQ